MCNNQWCFQGDRYYAVRWGFQIYQSDRAKDIDKV